MEAIYCCHAACWMQGSMHGPDVGQLLHMFALEDGDVTDRTLFVPVVERMERLRTAVAAMPIKATVAV